MHLPHDAVLLRIFIGENDRHGHQPLYEAIVLKARELGLAGATVLRGPMGFGQSHAIHTAKISKDWCQRISRGSADDVTRVSVFRSPPPSAIRALRRASSWC